MAEVTDIFIICLAFSTNIQSHLYVQSGTRVRQRLMDITLMDYINRVTLIHPAQSGQTVRLPVWPWQQVCVRLVRNGGGASIMNIHYDVTGWLTVVWRSHSGQIVWPAGVGQGRGGSKHIAHIRDIKESAGSRQLDRWRCTYRATLLHRMRHHRFLFGSRY